MKKKGKRVHIAVPDDTEETSGSSNASLDKKPQDIKDKNVLPAYDRDPGPMYHRSCRDVLFLILFLVFWAGNFYVASVAVKYGDPQRLIIPSDRSGQYCGVNNTAKNSSMYDYTERPYLYFFLPNQPTLSPQLCVNQCPNTTALASMDNKLCLDGVNPQNEAELVQAIVDRNCAPFTLKSNSVMGRCVPLDPLPEDIKNSATSFNVTTGSDAVSVDSLVATSRNFALQVVDDVNKSWVHIVVGAAFAMALCLVWIYLLRIFVKPMTYIAILGCNLALLGATLWLFSQWRIQTDAIAAKPADQVTSTETYENYGFLAGFIACGVLFLLFFCLSVFSIKRIKTGVAVIKESSKAIGSMPSIFLVPFIQWIFVAGFVLYFIYILLFMLTAEGEYVLGEEISKPYTIQNLNLYVLIYHIFGFFWGAAFLFGVGKVILAGAIATYYWTLDKRHMTHFPVMQSTWRTLIYHLGSIALGSLLLAIVQLISVIVWAARRNLKKNNGNKALGYFLACLQCFIKCLEGIVKWINKNAYIYIAINGTSFCVSAYGAFKLLVRNALKLVTVNLMADFILILSKLLITVSTFFIAWITIKYMDIGVMFTVIPALLIAMEAWIINSIFFDVYHMAVDTIFLCYLEDTERNDGSEEKPYYYSEGFKEIMGN